MRLLTLTLFIASPVRVCFQLYFDADDLNWRHRRVKPQQTAFFHLENAGVHHQKISCTKNVFPVLKQSSKSTMECFIVWLLQKGLIIVYSTQNPTDIASAPNCGTQENKRPFQWIQEERNAGKDRVTLTCVSDPLQSCLCVHIYYFFFPFFPFSHSSSLCASVNLCVRRLDSVCCLCEVCFLLWIGILWAHYQHSSSPAPEIWIPPLDTSRSFIQSSVNIKLN